MLGSRSDIIGDLFRLRHEIALNARNPEASDRYHDLQVLAAIAVSQGMSHNIVIKASDVRHDEIDTILLHHGDEVASLAERLGYHREERTGMVIKR